MRKIRLLFLWMILLTLGVATGPAFAADAAPASAAPVALDFLTPAPCPTATLSTPAPSPAALDLFGAMSCCRPECSVNSDCDRKCGKGLGTCVQVNSCCKQCICSIT